MNKKTEKWLAGFILLFLMILFALLVYFRQNSQDTAILQRIYNNHTLQIDSCDGTKNLFNSPELLEVEYPHNLSLDKQGMATSGRSVRVYEQMRATRLKQMFQFLNPNLDQLCLTQHQITNFVKNNIKDKQDWLNEGYKAREEYKDFGHDGFLFLFKENGEYFVADIYVLATTGGLYVKFYELKKSDNTYFSRENLWVVVPQLN